MTIKAIETVYKGYKFRSRLEARWAVFFDSLTIRYEYEAQGFELPGGVRYLPDFLLPELGVYAEIKASKEITVSEIRKLVLFAVDGDQPLLLITGSPTTEEMYLLDRRSGESWETLRAETEGDEDLMLAFWETLSDWSHVHIWPSLEGRTWALAYKSPPPVHEQRMRHALLTAKQSRFEFGETPHAGS